MTQEDMLHRCGPDGEPVAPTPDQDRLDKPNIERIPNRRIRDFEPLQRTAPGQMVPPPAQPWN